VNLLEETKLVLRQYNFRPSRRAGQNFLVREEVIQRQVGYAGVERGDVVLEIGAGIGNLTRYLLEKAGRVIAVEKDSVLLKILRERLGDRDNLVLVKGDAVKVELPEYDKVVSNIPYSISSPITFRILRRGFRIGVLTYQKEFAERLVAQPGTRNYSRLSVAAYYYARVRVLEYLPPGVFYPPPEVTSAIVELLPKKPPFKVNEELFFDVVRSLFIHRGKTLRSAILHSPMFPLEEGEKRRFIEGVGEDLMGKRVFQLNPEELASLTKDLERWKK
jgi:16S rRNA (adenine1518-N6/adenine1519-N6)-dimethyltransferase